MITSPILPPGTLTSGFQGQAANDGTPLPHVILQDIMDECLHSFIQDFDKSVRSLLGEMNLGAQLDKQNTRSPEMPDSLRLEVGVGDPIPLQLWQMAVTSYHDQMLQQDVERFKKINAHLDEAAMAHVLATSRYLDPDAEHKSMSAFSRAYVEEIRVFALARDLFRQNIQGVDIEMDMHQPAAGFIFPIMIITPSNGVSDLRMLVKNYVDSKQGKGHLSLAPV